MFEILNGKAEVYLYGSGNEITIVTKDAETYRKIYRLLKDMESVPTEKVKRLDAIEQLRKDLDELYATTWLGNVKRKGEK